MDWRAPFLIVLLTASSFCYDPEDDPQGTNDLVPMEQDDEKMKDYKLLHSAIVSELHRNKVLKIKHHLPTLLADCQAICGVQELVQMCIHCKSRQPYRFG